MDHLCGQLQPYGRFRQRETGGVRETKFNDRPVAFAQLLNTLTLKGGWQFELGGLFQSKGYAQNLRITNYYFNLTAAVQKTLLKDGSLVLRLGTGAGGDTKSRM